MGEHQLEPEAPAGARPWSAARGDRLRVARERAALSRAQVAAHLRVSEESVRRWERGGSKPSGDAVRAYLRVVGADAVAVEPAPEPVDVPQQPQIGELLRRRRLERGDSQVVAAATIGVAQATLAGWEIGRSRPGRDLAAALAAYLDVPLDVVDDALRPAVAVEVSQWPTFGRILGERRATLQLDRVQLAARMRVAPRTVAAWETGEKVPNNGHLARLAEVLDLEPSVLVSALPDTRPRAELGRLVQRRLRLLGRTRDELAMSCGVNAATIARWVTGRHAPTGTSIDALALALEVDRRVVELAVEVDHPVRGALR